MISSPASAVKDFGWALQTSCFRFGSLLFYLRGQLEWQRILFFDPNACIEKDLFFERKILSTECLIPVKSLCKKFKLIL